MSEGEPREDSPAPQLSPYHGSPQHAHKFASKHIGHVDQGGSKIGADLMDIKRKEHIAYEYLCHLEEAKKWIEACIDEELPSTTELEQALRNGVILCKLGHYCSPEAIPIRKIYDYDESKYRAKGLHFKHTDNFNYWLRALAKVGLPKTFYPTTTDLYDRKNMPRVIYCIHATSVYLHKLGKAPQIEDLLGTATFTEEEISAMRNELDKYGINMPSFGKIGGILANEMTVDEATMHAAILAVNEALDKGDTTETFTSLSNPNTCLAKLTEDNAARYQDILIKAKGNKASTSQNGGSMEEEEQDVYDIMLTQAEIQECIHDVNTAVKREEEEERMRDVVRVVNEAIRSGGKTTLLRSLQGEDARFDNIKPTNLQWYSDVLSKAIRDKSEEEGSEECQLGHREIQEIINIANEIAVHTRLVDSAVAVVNSTVMSESEDHTLESLQNEHLKLPDINPANSRYYQEGLLQKKKGKSNNRLTEGEIQDTIREMNAKAEMDRLVASAIVSINSSVEGSGDVDTLTTLKNECIEVGKIDESCGERYRAALADARSKKEEDLTLEEICKVVEEVNDEVRVEGLMDSAVAVVNSTVMSESEDHTLESLQNEHLNLSDINPANSRYYQEGLLQKKKGKSNNRLTEGEIQDTIREMNAKAEMDRLVASAIVSINSSVEGSGDVDTLTTLKNECIEVGKIDESCGERYRAALADARSKKEEDLTLEEICKVVEEVNDEVRVEGLMSDAITVINSSIEADDTAVLVENLHNYYSGLENVQDHEALQYLNVMKALRVAKAERSGNPDVQFTREEIQSVINKVNIQAADALELAEAINAINVGVSSGDSSSTLRALQSPSAGIRSITDECAEAYHQKLEAARQNKIDSGVEDSAGWSEHRTKEGNSYYHNSVTHKSQWEKPEEFKGQSRELSRDEIQCVVTKVTADFDRWTLMQANEPLIVQLQARWRGNLVRQPYQERLSYLRSHQDEAVRLQAYWKGFKQRKAYQERLEFLKKQAAVVVRIQAIARMWKARKTFTQRKEFFKAHEAEVIKIQSFLRAKKAKKDYTQLVQVNEGTFPPTSTVRKFLALLEQSDIDFSEELECQRLKAQVVHEIRSNQQVEQDLDVMDIKIGLLVKNRISLQDVVSTSQQVKHKDKKSNRHSMILDQGSGVGVGGLSKANHEKIEAYQHLFYLLQTNPNYFAKLIFEMPQNRTNRFMENVILTVFNYAQNNREQYLLIKLFHTALKEEIESKVDKVMDIVTGNPTVIKMVIHYTRGERGQNVLRELLGPLVQEVLDKKDLILNTGPVEIYRAWINQMETQTGEATKLPYDVSNDQALEHVEVRQRVQETIDTLSSLANRFQQSIFDNIDKIPYGMRYIAMQLRLLLHSKFPDSNEDDILKIVGNLVYYRYMNPAIVAPDAFDIVDVGVDQQLTPEQRRNLGSIAKVLQHGSAGKLFEAENAALSPMNPYIQGAFTKFKDFFLRASTVDPPDVKLGIDEYSDVTMLAKPVIYISIKEICSTHSLLIDHEEAVAPDPKDHLHVILKDLGPSPSIESLIGGVRDTAPGEDRDDLIAQAGKQEIPLTLNNKFESLADDDGSDMKPLFVRTKRMVVDVLKVQPGETLTDILYTPATPEQEAEHQELLQCREQAILENSQRSKILKKSESMHGDRNLPLEGMKRKIMRNLRTLEQEGMVNSTNDYQDIINAIAKDIRNQHRYRQQRKLELKRLSETMEKLNKKASFYEEQMDYYQLYVKACLDQLAKAGTGNRVRGPGEQGGSGFKKQSIKYNAHKLHEKGVILEIEGLPSHQFRNVSFEITSIDIGVFEVTGRFLGRQIEKVELVFQDLLQLQYEGLAIMKMFGRAKINVNLLIYLINKKFYGRVL